jgi:hypothetical protein
MASRSRSAPSWVSRNRRSGHHQIIHHPRAKWPCRQRHPRATGHSRPHHRRPPIGGHAGQRRRPWRNRPCYRRHPSRRRHACHHGPRLRWWRRDGSLTGPRSEPPSVSSQFRFLLPWPPPKVATPTIAEAPTGASGHVLPLVEPLGAPPLTKAVPKASQDVFDTQGKDPSPSGSGRAVVP